MVGLTSLVYVELDKAAEVPAELLLLLTVTL